MGGVGRYERGSGEQFGWREESGAGRWAWACSWVLRVLLAIMYMAQGHVLRPVSKKNGAMLAMS